MGRSAGTPAGSSLNLPLQIRPEAENDLNEAHTWYTERGRGQDFLDAIEEILHRMQMSPRMYPVVHRNVRRALVKRFRFAIFYVLQPERIVVLAIIHQSRDPARWQRRR